MGPRACRDWAVSFSSSWAPGVAGIHRRAENEEGTCGLDLAWCQGEKSGTLAGSHGDRPWLVNVHLGLELGLGWELREASMGG